MFRSYKLFPYSAQISVVSGVVLGPKIMKNHVLRGPGASRRGISWPLGTLRPFYWKKGLVPGAFWPPFWGLFWRCWHLNFVSFLWGFPGSYKEGQHAKMCSFWVFFGWLLDTFWSTFGHCKTIPKKVENTQTNIKLFINVENGIWNPYTPAQSKHTFSNSTLTRKCFRNTSAKHTKKLPKVTQNGRCLWPFC